MIYLGKKSGLPFNLLIRKVYIRATYTELIPYLIKTLSGFNYNLYPKYN